MWMERMADRENNNSKDDEEQKYWKLKIGNWKLVFKVLLKKYDKNVIH